MNTVVRGNTLLLLLGDIFIFLLALTVSLAIRYREIPSEHVLDEHLTPFLVLFILWSVVFWIAGLYDRRLLFARKRITGLVFKTQFINVLLAAVFFFVFPFGIEPKTNLVIYLIVSTALIVLWRLYVFPRLTAHSYVNILVLGDSPEGREITHVFSSNPYFKNLRTHTIGGQAMHDSATLRTQFMDVVVREQVDMIVADTRIPAVAEIARDFYTLVFADHAVRFFNLPALYEQLHHRLPPSLVGETWFLENVTTQSPHYAYDFLKRTVDIVGALVLLVPVAILSPFIVCAIKLGDGGPVFYTTERVGQYNRIIRIIKFRSMTGRDTGDEALQSTLRITRVGSVLRRTRLDELPQLWNILKGDLSFIGPRPEMPSLSAVYAEEIPYYNLRHLIKPGLSGWAQINHYDAPRAGVDVERTVEKLSFDLYYLKHRSFFLDIEIALKTINTVLSRTGT